MTKKQIYEKLYNYFDAPCEYGWFDMDANDAWCEKHCKKYKSGNWECWKHCFEEEEDETNIRNTK